MVGDTGNIRFMKEIEQSVRLANREVIHSNVPPITQDRMLSFALAVAKLRSKYIEAAFEFADNSQGDGSEKASSLNELERYKHEFEVARDAYIALQRAIELEYIDTE